MQCPQCQRAADASANNPYRPFCSRRCKMIDLGDWLDESNRIPTEADSDPAGEPWDTNADEPGSTSH